MSEPVLKAILRLFAIVAKEDEVTQQERDYVLAFLHDHLGRKSVMEKMAYFDDYARELSPDQESNVKALCHEINQEVTQKQKAVILLELLSVVLADGIISDKEREYVQQIGSSLNVSRSEIELMTHYILGNHRNAFDSDSILTIDSILEKPAHCKHIYREKLNGIIAILHLVTGDLYFFKYIGQEDVYLNGIPQKSSNISPLARGSSIRWEGTNIRWEGADPVYFGEILGKFKKKTTEARTTFEAKNISFHFKNGKIGLRNISLSEESGNLIALMGASGSGKSTLLQVLNGSEKPSDGQVLINSIDIHRNPDKVEGVFGFVPQDDLLMEDLTVYQNLYFAAKLCFDHLRESQINDLVIKTLSDLGLDELVVTEAGEHRLATDMAAWEATLGVPVEIREDTRFICSHAAFRTWAQDRKQLRMEYFYRQMRSDTGLLMDGDKPAGGRWNFDAENRKPVKADLFMPRPPCFAPDAETQSVLNLVEEHFADHFGDLTPFWFGVTHDAAERALEHFLSEALPHFGDHQDAMLTGEPFLYHSIISMYLNVGLLDARDICARAEQEYRSGRAPLNAVEGFIRQILGWREYVRGIYWREGPDYMRRNALGATRNLPWFYWSAETDMACMAAALVGLVGVVGAQTPQWWVKPGVGETNRSTLTTRDASGRIAGTASTSGLSGQQSVTYRDASGRIEGTAATRFSGNSASTTYRDPSGKIDGTTSSTRLGTGTRETYRDGSDRIQGTASTSRSGSSETTTFRDASGRITGTATTGSSGSTTYRDASGRIVGTAR